MDCTEHFIVTPLRQVILKAWLCWDELFLVGCCFFCSLLGKKTVFTWFGWLINHFNQHNNLLKWLKMMGSICCWIQMLRYEVLLESVFMSPSEFQTFPRRNFGRFTCCCWNFFPVACCSSLFQLLHVAVSGPCCLLEFTLTGPQICLGLTANEMHKRPIGLKSILLS